MESINQDDAGIHPGDGMIDIWRYRDANIPDDRLQRAEEIAAVLFELLKGQLPGKLPDGVQDRMAFGRDEWFPTDSPGSDPGSGADLVPQFMARYFEKREGESGMGCHVTLTGSINRSGIII